MSGPSRRLGLRPHRVPRPTIWAPAATVIVLALAACASTTVATPNPTPTASLFGASGQRATLTGAGSTFVAPFFDLAFAHHHQQQNPAVSTSYAAVGSGAGITAFSAKQADFGASDVPMTASEQAARKAGRRSRCPSLWGARAFRSAKIRKGSSG
jgi:ABC-type phosphate transport system substrate-binding protein